MVRLGIYPEDWAGDGKEDDADRGERREAERRWVSERLSPSYGRPREPLNERTMNVRSARESDRILRASEMTRSARSRRAYS